jgi:hypothetical protein
MANALKVINQRVKVLQKKHPKSKRSTLQKQAGREWKSGKLKAKRSAPKKKTVRRKPVTRKKSARKRSATRKRGRVGAVKILERGENTRTRSKRVYKMARRKNGTIRRYTRVGGAGSNKMMMVVAVAGLGLLAYMAFKKPEPPRYIPTGNASRDSKAAEIIQAATNAGVLSATAIMKLIDTLNKSSDAQINQAYDNVVDSGDVPDYLYA